MVAASVCGESRHAQVVMEELGITYQRATPKSIGDQWWFWNCSNVPDTLPRYLTPLGLSPHDAVGYGLSREMADEILAGKTNQPDLTTNTIEEEMSEVAYVCDNPKCIEHRQIPLSQKDSLCVTILGALCEKRQVRRYEYRDSPRQAEPSKVSLFFCETCHTALEMVAGEDVHRW